MQSYFGYIIKIMIAGILHNDFTHVAAIWFKNLHGIILFTKEDKTKFYETPLLLSLKNHRLT